MTLDGSFQTQCNRANMTQQLLIHFIWNTSYQWKMHGLRFDQLLLGIFLRRQCFCSISYSCVLLVHKLLSGIL